jgi:hypothetical protein
MHDQPTEQGTPRARPGVSARRPPASPSSSRMFASYLADIEQLLEAQRRDAALREALDLPRLAVALGDPRLRCTDEQVRTWCEEWIRPPGAERDAQGLDYERLGRNIIERLTQHPGTEGVPMQALRRLQLRRHAREAPRGFSAWHAPELPPRDAETVQMSTALLEAARRWYARSAVHDTVVQANLARLAVLR